MPELKMLSKAAKSTGDGEGGALYSKGSVLTARIWKSLEGVQTVDLGTKEPDFLLPMAGKTIGESEAGLKRKTRQKVGSIRKTVDPGWASALEQAKGRAKENLKQKK